MAMFLRVDSFSILFNHPSFQKPDPCSVGFKGGFLERFGSLGRKVMEGTPLLGLIQLGFRPVSGSVERKAPRLDMSLFRLKFVSRSQFTEWSSVLVSLAFPSKTRKKIGSLAKRFPLKHTYSDSAKFGSLAKRFHSYKLTPAFTRLQQTQINSGVSQAIQKRLHF